MSIREATVADVPDILRLVRDLAEYERELDKVEATEQDFRRLMFPDEGPATAFGHVAEVDGEVVGSLDARLLLPPAEAQFAFTRDLFAPRLRIEYLATAAAHRRTGVGTALVEAAEAWGREQGATVAELTTYHDSPLAYPFWTERAGYAPRSINLRKEL